MNARTIAALLSIILLSAAPPARLSAQRGEARKVEDAIEAFTAITRVRERELPDSMLKDSYGVAILPGVQKAGLMIGIQRGKGVLMVRDKERRWSNPVFVSLSGTSVGWQAGVQSIDLILFFQTRRSADEALRGAFTIGVDVAAAAGSLGRQAGASTDADLKAEIYSYSRSRGFFAGITLSGASLEVDDNANAAYYGRADLKPQDILAGKGLSIPQTAARLRRVLDEYTESLGKE